MNSGDMWFVATGEDEGKPLIFRVRKNPPEFAQESAFPHLLAVSWKYKSPNEQGMPSEGDTDRMAEFEELLTPAFEDAQRAFLTVVVTGNGVREWQWYASDVHEAMQLVNKALGQHAPFPVEFSFQDDPEWQGYSRFRAISD